MLRIRQGQTTIEYAVLLIVVIGALMLTGIYVRRGISGRWKQTLDEFGEQYDPTAMNTDIRYEIQSAATSVMSITRGAGGFWTNKTDTTSTNETKTGYMRVEGY